MRFLSPPEVNVESYPFGSNTQNAISSIFLSFILLPLPLGVKHSMKFHAELSFQAESKCVKQMMEKGLRAKLTKEDQFR